MPLRQPIFQVRGSSVTDVPLFKISLVAAPASNLLERCYSLLHLGHLSVSAHGPASPPAHVIGKCQARQKAVNKQSTFDGQFDLILRSKLS